MKKLLALLLLVSSVNAFSSEIAHSRQNPDGSVTTTYSDGTTAITQKNFDGSTTTRFSDGTIANSHENFDGSITTTY